MKYLINGLLTTLILCGVWLLNGPTPVGAAVDVGEGSSLYGTCIAYGIREVDECSATCGLRKGWGIRDGTSKSAGEICKDNKQCTTPIVAQGSCIGL